MPTLLTAQHCDGHIHLIIGSGPLAASRCNKSLEVGARPILIAPEQDELHFSVAKHIEDGQVQWTKKEFEDSDLTSLGRADVDHIVDAVFVTYGPRHPLSHRISSLCRRLRIPVNVVDAPQLCTFTLLSTYSDGPLQIGITTSGRGCKLASRIRREIASILPRDFGVAVDRLGTIRRKIWEEDQKDQNAPELDVEDEETNNQKHTFNTLVKEVEPDLAISRTRRMRWLSQICEYWPLKRLAAINDTDVVAILNAYKRRLSEASEAVSKDEVLAIPQIRRKGTITLAGSGPGSVSLLTIATSEAIKTAHYILADKLVPAEVLDLIPRRTPVHIARKFPGNADAAQDEMHELALSALQEGKDVLRLKQGDPYLYGRGAEEVQFFRDRGYDAKVLPGITSALSAPLFAGIPVTHRAVADQVVICTGTGRKGAVPSPPSYRSSKTVVFLMALHRLDDLVRDLTIQQTETLTRALWPKETPCAVIERASCPDQRIIRSTLEHVCQAVAEEGSRPPGLIVLGKACAVLHNLDAPQRWTIEEGMPSSNRTDMETASDLAALLPLQQQGSEYSKMGSLPADPSSTVEEAQMTIDFFDLPPELRAHIYREIYAGLRIYVAFWVTGSDDRACRETVRITAEPPLARTFLFVSKTAYNESHHLFYSLATVLVTGYGRHDHRLRSWLRILARLRNMRKHVTHVAFSSGFDSTDAFCFPEIDINRFAAFEFDSFPVQYRPKALTTPTNWTYYDVSPLQNLQRVTMYLSRSKYGRIWIYHANVHQFAHLEKSLKVAGRQSGRYVRAYARAMERYGSKVPRRLVVDVRWCLRRLKELEPMPSLLPEHQFSKICSFAFGPDSDISMIDRIGQDEEEHRGCVFCEEYGPQSLDLPAAEPGNT